MSDCADFLTALWGPEWAPRKVLLWKRQRPGTGGLSYYLDTAAQADAYEDEVDVYVAAGLLPRNFGATFRGRSTDVIGIPGVWLDIDVTGSPTDQPGKTKKNAAPDTDAALELARLLLPPTLLVTSGYGVQAWWLLEEPWLWAGENTGERARAQQVVYGWWLRNKREAKQAGYNLDATWELARLMRLPSTINGKAGLAAPVTWMDPDELGPRYSIGALEALGEQQTPPTSSTGGISVAVDPTATPNADMLIAAIDNDEDFADAWKRQGPAPDDPTPSAWCLRLANYAVRAGWTDQAITDLLLAYRRKHGDTEKTHQRWYGLTIAKARSGNNRERAAKEEEEALEEALEDLEDAAREAAPDQDRVLGSFNFLVPGLEARELVQQGKDPDSARFALVLADGSEIEIGSGHKLLDQQRVRVAISVATGLVMKRVTLPKWDKAVQALLKARRYVDAESEETVTVGWLQSYLDGRLATGADWNDAAFGKQPFRRDGMVHLSLEDLLRYVKRGQGESIARADLQRRIVRVGFTSVKVTCSPPGGKREGRTSRTFWFVAGERLE